VHLLSVYRCEKVACGLTLGRLEWFGLKLNFVHEKQRKEHRPQACAWVAVDWMKIGEKHLGFEHEMFGLGFESCFG
jgi:hypothetical protein